MSRGRPPTKDILTPREWEVLALVREGSTNIQIAERLGISEHAAKFHMAMIFKRLKVHNRREAALWVADRFVASNHH
ncbi:MAG: hypothetical protein GEU75_11805 [Dehalococcoidia bacterium]|nr:hypothetical protein [Dehalococcoidia bacterium]